MEIAVTDLDIGKKAIVARLVGGYGFQRKLRLLGIREGKEIKLVTKHPFAGPLVVEVEGREATIGRGMAHRIIVDV